MKHGMQSRCLPPLVLSATMLALCACAGRHADTIDAPMVVADGNKRVVPEKSPLRTRLVVQAVERRETPRALVAPAVVEADPAKTITIVPPLTGRVLELKVGLGDHVHRGQVLMVIASGDSAQAYSDVDKARDALDLAAKQLDRAREVKNAGGAATKDLESAQSAYNQARAEFDRATARLAALGPAAMDKSPAQRGTARQMTVAAPMDGVITTLAVAAGSYLNDATAAAMTLANLDKVWVTANVPEGDIAGIAKGQEVDVALAAYPGETLRGSVQFVDAVLAPDTRRERVRIAFANADGKLKPNMYATATFHLPQAAQVFVPQSAILMNNDSTSVFVEVAPWTFERRAVELADDEGDSMRIARGLAAGDRVVVRGGVLIND